MTRNDPILLIGRLFASAIFILGGYSKLMGAAGTIAYFTKVGVPMPDVSYWGAILIELGGGLLLLVGLQTRITALVLAAFCVATAVLAHADFGAAGQMTQFMKNMAMTGGYLAFAAAGAGRFSVDAALAARRA